MGPGCLDKRNVASAAWRSSMSSRSVGPLGFTARGLHGCLGLRTEFWGSRHMCMSF